jgi:hypothetical protein
MPLLTPAHRLRNGNAISCTTCGKPITPKPASRRQRYCSYSCRDEARRQRNFANFAYTRTPDKAIPRSARKIPALSKTCKGEKADRGFPLSQPRNVLGGCRWPHALRLERRVLDRILGCEVGGQLVEPPTPSPGSMRSTSANVSFMDSVASHQRGRP